MYSACWSAGTGSLAECAVVEVIRDGATSQTRRSRILDARWNRSHRGRERRADRQRRGKHRRGGPGLFTRSRHDIDQEISEPEDLRIARRLRARGAELLQAIDSTPWKDTQPIAPAFSPRDCGSADKPCRGPAIRQLLLVATGAAVKALEEYNHVSQLGCAGTMELQSIVGMLTESMAQIASASETSITRLHKRMGRLKAPR